MNHTSSHTTEAGPLPTITTLLKPPTPARPTTLGPSAPTPSDLLLAADDARLASRATFKSQRATAYARADELAPKAVGKEGKIAEKRAKGAEERAYAQRGADVATLGLEVDEGTLMGDSGGGGGSFAAA